MNCGAAGVRDREGVGEKSFCLARRLPLSPPGLLNGQ